MRSSVLISHDQDMAKAKYPARSKQTRGVRVEESRAVQFKAVVKDLSRGKGIRATAETHGMSHNTVQRIKRDCSEYIKSAQERNLEQMVVARDMAVSTFIRKIDEVDPSRLPVAIGILDDKIDRATSGPTRVEHVSVKIPVEVQARNIIDLLPTAINCDDGAKASETPVNIEPDDSLGNRCDGQADSVPGGEGATEVEAGD